MSMGNEGLLTLTVNVKVSPEPDSYQKIDRFNEKVQGSPQLFYKSYNRE